MTAGWVAARASASYDIVGGVMMKIRYLTLAVTLLGSWQPAWAGGGATYAVSCTRDAGCRAGYTWTNEKPCNAAGARGLSGTCVYTGSINVPGGCFASKAEAAKMNCAPGYQLAQGSTATCPQDLGTPERWFCVPQAKSPDIASTYPASNGAVDGFSRCFRALDTACPNYLPPSGDGASHAFGHLVDPQTDRMTNEAFWNLSGPSGNKPVTEPTYAPGTMVPTRDPVTGKQGVFIFAEGKSGGDPAGETSYFCAYPDAVLQAKDTAVKPLRFEIPPAARITDNAAQDAAVRSTSILTYYANYQGATHRLWGEHDAPMTKPETIQCTEVARPQGAVNRLSWDAKRFFQPSAPNGPTPVTQCIRDVVSATRDGASYGAWLADRRQDPSRQLTAKQLKARKDKSIAQYSQETPAALTQFRTVLLNKIKTAADSCQVYLSRLDGQNKPLDGDFVAFASNTDQQVQAALAQPTVGSDAQRGTASSANGAQAPSHQ